MTGFPVLPTTKNRHKKIFDRYLSLLRQEYDENPEKALALPKSHFYNELAKEFDISSSRIGRIVQLCFKETGSPPSRTTKAINKEDMDPQVRFILGFTDEKP